MEAYGFKIANIEQHFIEIRNGLQIINLAIYGLLELDILNMQQTTSFISLIQSSHDKLDEIIKSMVPIDNEVLKKIF